MNTPTVLPITSPGQNTRPARSPSIWAARVGACLIAAAALALIPLGSVAAHGGTHTDTHHADFPPINDEWLVWDLQGGRVYR